MQPRSEELEPTAAHATLGADHWHVDGVVSESAKGEQCRRGDGGRSNEWEARIPDHVIDALLRTVMQY